MNILALETATDACSVALLTASGLHFRHQLAAREHTDLVLGMIDEVLADGGIARGDIQALAFGHGPGSFTGVRIAASLAQGIAAARDLPVAPISSLRALAAGAHRLDSGKRVLVALDARRAEIYFAAYQFDTGDSPGTILIEDCVMAPEAVIVPAATDWQRAGNGWRVYETRYPAALGAWPPARIEYPHARDVARLAALDLAAGHGLSAHQALPRYLRGAVD